MPSNGKHVFSLGPIDKVFTLAPPPPQPSTNRRRRRRRRRKRVDPELFDRAKQWLKEHKRWWKGQVSYNTAQRVAISAFRHRRNRLAKSSCGCGLCGGESCGSECSDYECSNMIWEMINSIW